MNDANHPGVSNSTMLGGIVPLSMNNSVLSDSLVPGGIPKRVLLPSINIKRLLDKFDESRKTNRQRNHTVVCTGLVSGSKDSRTGGATNRNDMSILSLDKAIIEGKS